jgi:hypothetical protein
VVYATAGRGWVTVMAIREVVSLYNQDVTDFDMRIWIRPDVETDGALLLALAEEFIANLVLPGCQLTSLWTKRPEEDAKLNIGDFSDRRWNASVKKLRAGEYHVLRLEARNPHWPTHQVSFGAQINPPPERRRYPVPVIGDVHVRCSLSYLRQLAESRERVDALIQLGEAAWDGVGGGAYGFGNLRFFEKIVPFNPLGPQDPDYVPPWEQPKSAPDVRPHAIPVAYTGLNVDLNLEDHYCAGRGIKGAFWANYLSKVYVDMTGGEQRVRDGLPGFRIEALRAGGLLIIATDSPLPEDTEENRQRFLTLHRVLQPAFISRTEATDRKRRLLSYFYRERASVVP